MRLHLAILFLGLAVVWAGAGIAAPAQTPSAGAAPSPHRSPGFLVLDGVDTTDHSPEIRVVDLDGLKKLLLRDPKDTRPLLVNFWATWCDGCREEFPDLVKIDNDYRAKGLIFLSVTLDEFTRVKVLLGREPNLVELGVFSVMWSEHCSYKSSRVHLKRLPTTGERVIVPPGENAGVVDVGDGWCAAFKIESHNHPSFIEPFQGAATGVGGILRDIFTMGARPIAAMNSLRFGSLDDPKNGRRNRSLLAGVVAGIAHYGNAFGVPTVGGEVSFDDAYALNPLINAFALGLVRKDQIFFGKATGVGNPVLYVCAKTGRDGIHGATMASAAFDEEALEKRPTVQVGDPFLEKLLLEPCLEAMRSGAVAGIQDMGAAGLSG